MPLVDLQLDAVALFEQIAVEWRKFMHQIGKALPKCHGFYGRMLGQHFFFDKLIQIFVYLQIGSGDIAICHLNSPNVLFLMWAYPSKLIGKIPLI